MNKISKVCEFKNLDNPYPENELPDTDYGGCKYLGYAGLKGNSKTCMYYFKCHCGNVFKDIASSVIKKYNPCCGCGKEPVKWKESSSLFELHMKSWNPDTHKPSVKKLPIFKGIIGREKVRGFTYVNEDVYKVWSRIMWIRGCSGYVIANYSKDNCNRLGILPPANRCSLTLHLHRCVLGISNEVRYLADHLSGNVKDNRVCNLRIATNAENNYNKNKINNKQGVIGVKFNESIPPHHKRWRAQIQFQGKSVSKAFHTKYEASYYRDLMAVDLHGVFASLNHPDNLEEYKTKLHTLHYK